MRDEPFVELRQTLPRRSGVAAWTCQQLWDIASTVGGLGMLGVQVVGVLIARCLTPVVGLLALLSGTTLIAAVVFLAQGEYHPAAGLGFAGFCCAILSGLVARLAALLDPYWAVTPTRDVTR